MRYTNGLYVFVLVVITGLAGAMSAQFGYDIGEINGHGLQFAAMFGACSVMLPILGFVRKSARDAGQNGKADLAWVVTLAFALLEFTAGIAVIGSQRFAASATVDNQITVVSNLDSEIDELKKQVESVADIPRQVYAIEAAQSELMHTIVKGKIVADRVGDCTNLQSSPETVKKFCPQLASLSTELALANQYWQAHTKLSGLRNQRSIVTKPVTSNAQATVLADLLPGDTGLWQSILVFFMATVIVGIGVFGPEIIPSVQVVELVPRLSLPVPMPVAPVPVSVPRIELIEDEEEVESVPNYPVIPVGSDVAVPRERIRVIYRERKVPVIRYRTVKAKKKKKKRVVRKPKLSLVQ